MEEFFAKYGVRNKAELFEHVKSNSVFALTVVSDLFDEKFPVVPIVEQAVEEQQNAPEV